MKEFDLSEKELKALLKTEGLEEPSMGFNYALLEKVKQYEKTRIRPVRIPQWMKLVYFSVIIIAVIGLFLSSQNVELDFIGLAYLANFFTASMDLSLLFLGALGIVVVWAAYFLNRHLQHRELSSAVKKS